MIRALMMDVDGVLVRGRPTDGRNWAARLQEDLGLDPAVLHRAFFAPHWHDIVVGRAGLMDRLAPVLAEIAPALGAERLVEYWFSQDARLDQAVLADLAALRTQGVQICLATNQEHLRAAYLMTRLGLGAYAQAIHYSAALGARKPDPAFFARAAEAAGFEPSSLMLVDDTGENIAAAQRAGWQARHWTGQTPLASLIAASA